jgi:hypothetical protein
LKKQERKGERERERGIRQQKNDRKMSEREEKK